MKDLQVKQAGADFDAITDVRERNQLLMQRIESADNGHLKEASAAGSSMIRRRIREEGFLRSILPPMTKSNADLNRVVEHDRPVIIEDMEPLSRGARSITFGDTADTQFYNGNKFVVVFNPITTPEWTKDINELRTYQMDLRQVITNNSLLDVHTHEDERFLSLVDTVVGPVGGVGASGFAQNFQIQGGITRDTYPEVLSKLEDLNLPNGCILMNRRTAKEFLKWDRSEIGGDLAQDLVKDGLSAFKDAVIFGTKHRFTIKRNLVPDNVLYIFAEPSYLGRFYELAPLTMYIEKKVDTLRFSAREVVGLTIANVAGVAKVTFV